MNFVIVFAMLSAHGIWRETVSLLDGRAAVGKRQLYNKEGCVTFYLITSKLEVLVGHSGQILAEASSTILSCFFILENNSL